MVGKNVLPIVGGAPAVWNSCMLLFQFLLLAGYAWAHWAIKKLGLGRQAILQLILMVAALFFLPDLLKISRNAPDEPAIWLVLQLLKTVGLPFFILAAMSPLLQLWFSSSGHPKSANPYFLFAASNLGSFAALIIYPLIIEPLLTIQQQANTWNTGFIVLLLMLYFCHKQIRDPQSEQKSGDEVSLTPVTSSRMIKWCVAAIFPSSLLLSVTYFITTDLAPVPLLWVLPLMTYLATFIIAFSQLMPSAQTIEKLAIAGILLFPVGFFLITTNLWVGIPLHLFTLFSISLLCHGYLASDRPPVSQLTVFYTIISLGGMLGGLFNTLIAPHLFTTCAEYPLLIIFTCFLLRRFKSSNAINAGETPEQQESISLSVIFGLYAAVLLAMTNQLNLPLFFQQISLFAGFDSTLFPVSNIIRLLEEQQLTIRGLSLVIMALFPLFLLRKMPRLNLALFSLIVMSFLFVWKTGHSSINMARARNFFGTKMVQFNPQLKIRSLVHGTTVHGNQCFAQGYDEMPLTYFHTLGPVGDVFSWARTQKSQLKTGILGLGIGSIAAYSQASDSFIFYEIDPQVIQLALNPDLFTFISNNINNCRIACGDGRKMINSAPEKYFDLIFFDAFSSGAIPVHLITVEAINEYLQRLSPDGLLILNITNRYLNLKPALSAAARATGLAAITAGDNEFDKTSPENFQRFASEYVVMARNPQQLKSFMETGRHDWRFIDQYAGYPAWTDSHSSLLPALNFMVQPENQP